MNKNELNVDCTKYETTLPPKFLNRKPYTPKNPNVIQAIIPGSILEVFVKTGDLVYPGDSLLILEAMKMKNNIRSARQGKIKKICVQPGDQIPKGHILIEFES